MLTSSSADSLLERERLHQRTPEDNEIIVHDGTPIRRAYLMICQSKQAKTFWLIAFVVFILGSFVGIPTYFALSSLSNSGPSGTIPGAPKNVIFMVTDGFGPASVTFARECAKLANFSQVYAKGLPMDQYLVGTVRTYSSSSLVTDSAAGATAYSCGLKTYNAAIGVDPNQKPCGTLLEAAKAQGMKTGFVVTSRVTHATPASFTSHSVQRDLEEFIAKQQVDNMVDVMFGGGLAMYANRSDNLNLVNYARQKGFVVAENLAGYNQIESTPAIALLASSHMSYEIDRNPSIQPSLAEMTTKALSLLKGSQGFFLVVEGSRIDMAGHSNDPAAHYRDIIAYNEALRVVMNFAKEDGNTMVISTSDHETGGLTLGRTWKNESYPIYDWFPSVVLQVKASTEYMAKLINTGSDTAAVLRQYAGFDPTTDELDIIFNSGGLIIEAIGDVISNRARIGWSTYGHTGVDVNMYTYGYKVEGLKGNMENIAVGQYVADTFGFNLPEITAKISGFSPFPPPQMRRKTADEHHPFV